MLDNELLLRVAALLAVTVLLLAGAVFTRLRTRRPRARTDELAPTTDSAPATAGGTGNAAPIPYLDHAIESMTLAVFRRAFGAQQFNYAILGEHRAVMDSVRQAIPRVASNREYFPRRPLVMPRLLAAIRSPESSLKELVEISVQDPALAGDVLRTANSPFYRLSREPADSIGRAVVLLGLDGLRSVVATSVMQPVFLVPRGYFEEFSGTIWRQAQYASLAAQQYARLTGSCDSFAAHLLALLYHMSYIVIFRMTVATYVLAPGSLPRAEVFTHLIDGCADELARHIAAEWELPLPMIDALAEHEARCPVEHMSPLARALYVGRICGAAAIAAEGDPAARDELPLLLERKGLLSSQAESLQRSTFQREAA